MFYQQPMSTNGNFTIPYDGTREQFDTTFPISLVARVHPNQFLTTLQQCNAIMKKHMETITKSDKKVLWVILGLVAIMIFMIAFPTVLVTAIAPVSDSDAWIPAVFIPILACIPMIGIVIYSHRRVQQIKLIHAECKKEMDEVLAQENEMYFQLGVQWILRYDAEAVGKTRFAVYKHLTVMPCLEILVNPQMFVIPQQTSQPVVFGQQPIYVQQEQLPTTEPMQQVVFEQQPTSMVYQQVNQYQKENDNQPLLGNRV